MAQDTVDPWIKKKADSFRPLSAEQMAAVENAVPAESTAKPKKARRILVFYRCEGFIHGSIPYANLALETMGKKTGAFTVDMADTYDVFNVENLKKYKTANHYNLLMHLVIL